MRPLTRRIAAALVGVLAGATLVPVAALANPACPYQRTCLYTQTYFAGGWNQFPTGTRTSLAGWDMNNNAESIWNNTDREIRVVGNEGCVTQAGGGWVRYVAAHTQMYRLPAGWPDRISCVITY